MAVDPSDLCALEDVQAFLGVDPGQDDDLLARMITQSSQYFVNKIGREIKATTYTDAFSGSELQPAWGRSLFSANSWLIGREGSSGAQFVSLRNGPIISVTSVTVDNVLVLPRDPADVTADGWVIDNTRLVLSGLTNVFTRGLKNIVVVYSAGWTQVPMDVNDAVVQLTAFRYRERTHFGITSKGLGGESIQYIKDAEPPYVKSVIDEYSWALVG